MADAAPGLFDFTSVQEMYRVYLQPAIFSPWASELLVFVPPAYGDVVLDVAAGTGAVAHAAADVVGPGGRVIASDVSARMLAAASLDEDGERAHVEVLECPADQLELPDGTVDVVYCQQGLQFMPDRAAVLAEMHRVLRPGGMAAVAVWSDRQPPEPFDTYARVLAAHDVAEPYPHAYDMSLVTMSEEDVKSLLSGSGFSDATVITAELAPLWPDARSAALGILGTPYGPAVASLPAPEQQAILASIVAEIEGRDGRALMSSVFGRASA